MVCLGVEMSRIGNSPVVVPDGVSVTLKDMDITVVGRHGTLKLRLPDGTCVHHDRERHSLVVERVSEIRRAKALHGLTRALLSNIVKGVHDRWEKRLEIVGVGFQASLSNGKLTLNVGFANPVIIPIPSEVICELPDNTHVMLRSADRQLVGQVAANIRSVRPPEPYKGKGIRYAGERVKRKQGKAFGS